MKAIQDHPCFNRGSAHAFARVHLPVAPACNIQCNFCDRKYDCVNESRPGVTSAILQPEQALAYLVDQCARRPDIRVVGIAGPGDSLADPDRTLRTLELIGERLPNMLLCLATNGLRLPNYAEQLVKLGVTHLTVTVNAIDSSIGKRVYAWINDNGVKLRGREAAETLLAAQENGIRALANSDIIVKVNTIVIPGVNDHHLGDIARTVHRWGADIMNCMPLKPTPGTPFEHILEPTPAEIAEYQRQAGKHINQMTHCTRCRSDACGKLGEANPKAMKALRELAQSHTKTEPPKNPDPVREVTAPTPANRPYAAVASRDGYFVNQHLGEADEILIYTVNDDNFELVDVRTMPPRGTGDSRWRQASELLADCRSLVVSGVGQAPRKCLADAGIEVVEAAGLIADILEPVFQGRELPAAAQRCFAGCGSACTGTGLGCG